MRVLPEARIYDTIHIKTLETEAVKKLRTEIKEARAQRLYVHLMSLVVIYIVNISAHLVSKPVLTENKICRYVLRYRRPLRKKKRQK